MADPLVFLAMSSCTALAQPPTADLTTPASSDKQLQASDGKSIYKEKVIEVVGTHPGGWEQAVKEIITAATKCISASDIRTVEVEKLGVTVKTNGNIDQYVVKVKIRANIDICNHADLSRDIRSELTRSERASHS